MADEQPQEVAVESPSSTSSTTTSSSTTSTSTGGVPAAYSLVWSKGDGFPWWPSVVVDEDAIPNYPKVLAAKLPDHVLVMYFPLARRFFGWVKPDLVAPFDEETKATYLGKNAKGSKQVAKSYSEALELLQANTDFQALIRQVNDEAQPAKPKREKKDKPQDKKKKDPSEKKDKDSSSSSSSSSPSKKEKITKDTTDKASDSPSKPAKSPKTPKPSKEPVKAKTPKETATKGTPGRKRRVSDGEALEPPKAKRAKKDSSEVVYTVDTTTEQASRIAADLTAALKHHNTPLLLSILQFLARLRVTIPILKESGIAKRVRLVKRFSTDPQVLALATEIFESYERLVDASTEDVTSTSASASSNSTTTSATTTTTTTTTTPTTSQTSTESSAATSSDTTASESSSSTTTNNIDHSSSNNSNSMDVETTTTAATSTESDEPTSDSTAEVL